MKGVLSNLVGPPHSGGHSLTDRHQTSAQHSNHCRTLFRGKPYRNRGNFSDWATKEAKTNIDRLQRDAKCLRKVLARCVTQSREKGSRHGLEWLTLVHGPEARLSSTSKRYFGRSGLSQLYWGPVYYTQCVMPKTRGNRASSLRNHATGCICVFNVPEHWLGGDGYLDSTRFHFQLITFLTARADAFSSGRLLTNK